MARPAVRRGPSGCGGPRPWQTPTCGGTARCGAAGRRLKCNTRTPWPWFCAAGGTEGFACVAGPLAGCCTNANTRPAFVLGTGGVLPACGWVARLLSTTAEHTCYRVLGFRVRVACRYQGHLLLPASCAAGAALLRAGSHDVCQGGAAAIGQQHPGHVSYHLKCSHPLGARPCAVLCWQRGCKPFEPPSGAVSTHRTRPALQLDVRCSYFTASSARQAGRQRRGQGISGGG